MTRISTLRRWQWISLALVTVSAVLIAIGGSEASANPDGKTYTATLAPSEVTAGADTLFTLTVTNTSDSTPLGAVNIEVPIEFELTAPPAVVLTPDGKSWTVGLSDRIIELRADTSSDRLGPAVYDEGTEALVYESVELTFGAIGLQEFIGSETHIDYVFSINARQANSFAGYPGNGLTYVGPNPFGPEVRVFGEAKRCTTNPCELEQNLGSATAGTFTLSATCVLADCGIVAIEYVFEEGAISPDSVIYTPAEHSANVRAYLTLPKEELTKAASQYTFELDLLKGDGSFTVEKCHRGDKNCIEKIERTKTDVTWIFRVDPVDPRMSW